MVTIPGLAIPPPLTEAILSTMVLSLIVVTAGIKLKSPRLTLFMIAPPPNSAKLPLKVLLLTIRVPSLRIAPPLRAILLLRVLL